MTPPCPIRNAGELDFHVGHPIRVYHHPADPSRAVLDPHIATLDRVLGVFVTALGALGVVAAFLGRFDPKGGCPPDRPSTPSLPIPRER